MYLFCNNIFRKILAFFFSSTVSSSYEPLTQYQCRNIVPHWFIETEFCFFFLYFCRISFLFFIKERVEKVLHVYKKAYFTVPSKINYILSAAFKLYRAIK